jgi:hypothetical protein
VYSRLSALANGAQSWADYGVPWHITTAGPVPNVSHATERPRHSNVRESFMIG